MLRIRTNFLPAIYRVADEKERRGCRIALSFDSRFPFRPPRVPIGGALEQAGDAQELLFLERGGEDLQANR
jgi:hypothetical protein